MYLVADISLLMNMTCFLVIAAILNTIDIFVWPPHYLCCGAEPSGNGCEKQWLCCNISVKDDTVSGCEEFWPCCDNKTCLKRRRCCENDEGCQWVCPDCLQEEGNPAIRHRCKGQKHKYIL